MHETNHGTGFIRRPIVYQMRHAVKTTRLDIFLNWFWGDLMFLVSATLRIPCHYSWSSNSLFLFASEAGGSFELLQWRRHGGKPPAVIDCSTLLACAQIVSDTCA